MVRYYGLCVTRYSRRAGGITTFRAACDHYYTQEFVPLAETIMFKIMSPEHRGLLSGKRLRGTKESGYANQRKTGVMGARTILRLEPPKRAETSINVAASHLMESEIYDPLCFLRFVNVFQYVVV